jgi:hypothetical protein
VQRSGGERGTLLFAAAAKVTTSRTREHELAGTAERARTQHAIPAVGQAPMHAHVMRLQMSAGNRAVAKVLSRKSDAVIARRRALKRHVVEELTKIAVAGNVGYRKLSDGEVYNLLALLGPLHRGLTARAADVDTLKTAKGCKHSPDGLQNPGDATLYDFLNNHTQAGGCGEGVSADAALWAQQVVTENPDRVKLQAAWPGQKGRINAAWQAAENDLESWLANPGERGPRSANESLYYLAFMVQKRNMTKKDLGGFDDIRAELAEQFPNPSLDKDKATYAWAKKADLNALSNKCRTGAT